LKALQQLGDWRLVHRIRETCSGAHWQTANGFLLVELPSETVQAPATPGAFSRCIETFAGIFRPDIARVVDWTSDGECRYVVLEVPAGVTLRELEERIFLPPDVRARITLDVLEAVEAAHASSAVFGDLDADGVIVSEGGHVVLLPTCSRARAPADDIAAVAKLAGIPHFQQTTHTLGNRLRALGAVANRETVARFVSRMVLASSRPQRTTSQPAPRAFSRSFSDDDLTPVRPVDLDRMRARAISELSPDDLIPLGRSEPEIVVHIEQPQILRNTERPVVSEAKFVDLRARPIERSRLKLTLLMAALLAACAAVGVTGAVWWRTPPAWVAPAVLALQHTLQPAAPTAPVAQQATAAQPATVAAPSRPEVTAVSPPDVGAATTATTPTPPRPAETAQAGAAPASRTLAPAKRTAPRRHAPRTGTRRRTARDTTKARESSGYRFMPKQL
jgi:hypothetical protein